MKKSKSLPSYILKVTENKATEPPFTGEFTDTIESGTYLCRQCGLALFRSQTKFHSGCGWASFDGEISDAVTRIPDADGRRIEITCARCHAHLGHVFEGEGYTKQNVRHCVNSLSLDFVHDTQVIDTEEAIFAAGCFWGVEYFFKKLKGVLKTEVGYIGGHKNQPTYEDVCSHKTGHLEAIRVIYDSSVLNFETVAKYFFEIHDPTQHNGQGPDLGDQYLSAIFVYDEAQKQIAQKLISELKNKNISVATKLLPMNVFWPAEDYHQNYYEKTQKEPYCHIYKKLF